MFGVGTVGTAYPNFDLSTLVSSNSCCDNITYTITNTNNATWTGTLPNIVITPTDTVWSVTYEVCCDNGTCDSGVVNGTACEPFINTNMVDFDVIHGVGTPNVAYPTYDINNMIVSQGCDCEPISYNIITTTNATVSGTAPNLTITPLGGGTGAWGVTIQFCCDGNTDCDVSSIVGTAVCVESITVPTIFDFNAHNGGLGCSGVHTQFLMSVH